MKQYLFVYGSLRKGFEPPEIAETAAKLEFFAEGFVYANIYDLGEYRGLVLGGTEKISGQILALPDDTEVLQRLDEYEGFDANDSEKSPFRRVKTFAHFGDETIETWVYEYNLSKNSD